MAENKIRITLTKGRPMLYWVGKKSLMSGSDYVRKVKLRGLKGTRTDVDDADLQFMYERIEFFTGVIDKTGRYYGDVILRHVLGGE